MKIKFVTVTGADDFVAHDDLLLLQQEFPYVEWGILLGEGSEGTSRFPKYAWQRKLLDQDRLRLSAHLCGRWLRYIVAGKPSYPDLRPDTFGIFHRVQLNFHGEPQEPTPAFYGTLISWGKQGKQVIFQADGENERLFRAAVEAGINVAPLFDRSHGEGVIPDQWPEPIGDFCGYAGGLGPDNLAIELRRIEEVWAIRRSGSTSRQRLVHAKSSIWARCVRFWKQPSPGRRTLMKPTAKCRHAQTIIENKWYYKEDEIQEGCWACGGPLTPLKKKQHADLSNINMVDEDRARLEANPDEANWMLDWLNEPEWVCLPCQANRVEGFKKLKPEDGVDIKTLIRKLGDAESFRRERLALIAEIEACVPDCPYRDHLPEYYRSLEE